ncbi:AAA family ATPase [Streptomyces sp. NPDC048297]|uniref:AAA family ATPase n=1 Tax=Streptomyces sp. NPDC048297 TaxID=3365531 RepID=UPI0037215F87
MEHGTSVTPVLLDAERLGRGTQWAFLRTAIENVAEAGGALWLRGEPGTGKTVLLDQAHQFAEGRGLRVLRVNGARAESAIPYAALHQLLWPLSDHMHRISAVARAVLRRVLETEQSGPPLAPTVTAATMELLDKVARDRPLLVAIDDLHRVDAASVAVLCFLRRRAGAAPLLLVATVGDEALTAIDLAGPQVLAIDPLSDEYAELLLTESWPGLSATTRARVLREAAGNPLALVELPAELCEPERQGRLPLPDHLPLGERLERSFSRHFEALGPEARFTLLLCALADADAGAHADADTDDDAGDQVRNIADAGDQIRHVADAAREAGVTEAGSHLRAAREHGLIHVDDRHRVRFRHPLIASCLVQTAEAGERRRAHAAWAGVLPQGEPRQVTHRAEAAHAPDEAVAAALVAAAWVAQTRGHDVDAACLLARAAAFSGGAEQRGTRLVTAARAAARGHHIALAARLLDQAIAHGVPAYSRNVLDYTRALVRLHADGDPGPAVDLLPALLDRLPAEERGLRLPALFLLMLAAGLTAEPEAWKAVECHMAGTPEIYRVGLDAWNAPIRHAKGGHERLAAALRLAPGDARTAEARVELWAAAGLDAVGDHAQRWHRMADRYPTATQALADAALAHDDNLRGHWGRCLARMKSAEALARARGSDLDAAVYACTAAYVSAARGEREAVAELVDRLRPWAVARGLTFLVHRLDALQAASALAVGDYESAYRHATMLTPPGVLPATAGQFHLVFLDLVESALHTGRTTEARHHVTAGRAAGMHRISPRHTFLLLAAEAMTSDDADTAYASVHTSPHAGAWPFELARVRRHHGAWLRRRGRRVEARCQLESAQRAFAVLEAEPWRQRTLQELRVCDEPGPSVPQDGSGARLTPQEQRIAELVAAGLTNRDIGARLGLSPRTVAGHLYRIYPKLNVTTRAGVARALHPGRTT